MSVLLVIGVWFKFIFWDNYLNENMLIGVSYDPEYAGSLKLDTVKAFKTIVNEWNFKYVRLPAHWDKVEKERGKFDFSELDFYMGESAKSGVKVMLAIGNKTPRWPECHTPLWATNLSREEYDKALREYIRTAVEHFKDHPALEMWQVENEPFLGFGGDCVRITPQQLKEEVELVKSIDKYHPTLVSDTGELSLWRKTATAGDFFGTTLYRVVWSKYLGYWRYDWLPAAFYRLKLKMAGRSPESAFVVELQGEAWAPNKPITEVSIEEQSKSMNVQRLKKNLDFAKKLGLPRVYLWGAEWWNWLKENGHNEIPDTVAGFNR